MNALDLSLLCRRQEHNKFKKNLTPVEDYLSYFFPKGEVACLFCYVNLFSRLSFYSATVFKSKVFSGQINSVQSGP